MPTDLVTGAYGFTGSRIAERLLADGRQVRTLSRRRSPSHPLAGRVQAFPATFDEPTLESALEDVDTVYVTYWMRFPRGETTWKQVVDNVAQLTRAAASAGVRRLVYVSVTTAGHESPTAYFRAKAAAEDAVREVANDPTNSLSVAIVRPTLLFGDGDILINNMAWTLRRLPVFGVPGDGRYRVQPVLVDDVADLCIRLGDGDDSIAIDAAGPETLTFDEAVAIVRAAVGSRALVLHLPKALVLATTKLIGVAVRDVVLTRDEILELTSSLLVATDPLGTCPTRFSDWVAANGASLGRRWSSELRRNFRIT